MRLLLQTNETESDKLNQLIGLVQVLNEHDNYIKQREEDYLEFISFLLEQEEWEREVIIIKESDWNEFYNTDDEDFEMKITAYVQASEFYDKFAKLVGIGVEDFDNNFVSAKYIDRYTYNTIELTVRIDNKDEVFIIDAV